MNKVLGIVFLSLFSFYVDAEPEVTSSAVPQNFHIYSQSGDAYVDMPAAGCSTGRYILPRNHLSFESIVSTIIAAQMASREIKIRFDECNSNARGYIIGVYLK